MKHFDAIIVGAGIAGASLAAEIAPLMSVLILEMEDQPGYHTTGRSNAFWHATYGGPAVEPLTTASLEWLRSPPAEFAGSGFLSARGAITLAHHQSQSALDQFAASFSGTRIELERIGRDGLMAMIPGLRPEWQSGILERSCFDIDVAALHSFCLAVARKHGAVLSCRQELTSAARLRGNWQIETRDGVFTATVLINAAGAWADQVAMVAGARPLGIQPYRRTITQLSVESEVPADLPLVIDVDGAFYFRPDHGQVWLSPHDETPSAACDAAPEELDIAVAIDRFEKVVDWPIRHVGQAGQG